MEKFTYKYVAVIGLDGMGAFDRFTDTPNFDRIFENGAVSHSSLSLYPTISAQNWGAMLLGANPSVHKLTNGIVSREHYTNRELPSVFYTLRAADENARLISVCHWSPVNYGIIEEDIGVIKENASSGAETADKTVELLKQGIPQLLFVHIDDPDHGGHTYSYGSEGHLESIRESDGLTGRIFDAYEEAGVLDDTLFITVTDHGGYDHGHGGYTDGEKYVFFALRGKTVKKTDDFFARTKDINAIVLHALGLPVPAYKKGGYTSQIPEGVFTDCDTPYITEDGCRNDVKNLPTPAVDGEGGLYSYFSKDDIRFALFLDNDVSDAAGRASFVEDGTVKFYSEGVRGSTGEFGVTGILTSEEIKFGSESFSVAAWLSVDDAPGSECWYCSNKTMAASGAGFSMGFTNAGTIFGIETEDPSSYDEITVDYVEDVAGGWINVVNVVDKEKLEVRVYQNFRLKLTHKLSDIFACSADSLPLTIGEDGSHTCNRRGSLVFRADDIIAFSRALNDEDIKKLEEYYK